VVRSRTLDARPRQLRRATAWLAVGTLLVLAAPAVGDARRGTSVDRLRDEGSRISQTRHAAVLELYALDSRLAGERARLGTLELRIGDIRRQQRDVAVQLRVARRGAALAERQLARRVHLLYEQSEVDPLAIILGASSLDDALASLDDLKRTTAHDQRVVSELRAARTRLATLERALTERETDLVRLRAESMQTASSLAAARSARSRYLRQLERKEALTKARIASIERQARLARQRSEQLTEPLRIAASGQASASVVTQPQPTDSTQAVASPQSSASPQPEASAQPAPSAHGPRTLTVVATGYSIHGTTATGLPTGWGIVAVDPSVIPLGTRLTIPGYGEAVAADVGSAVQGAHIDLWFPTIGQALEWGRRTVTIELH
jgi:3D (Asp-Asp-Asp) domain-containing protein/chaperonin cofactor prefoldin